MPASTLTLPSSNCECSCSMSNAAVFRFHMRLRVAPVRLGCGSPGTVPGVRWPNLAAPIRLLLSSIIQTKCRHRGSLPWSCGVDRETQARRCGYDSQSSAAKFMGVLSRGRISVCADKRHSEQSRAGVTDECFSVAAVGLEHL